MTEIETLDKETQNHIDADINWEADKNAVIIAANESEMSRGDVEQFASDSFYHGWQKAKEYFEALK